MQIAEDLDTGSVLALKGELGSGKSIFTKGLVAGLGSSAAATSPTFTIVHEYQGGRLPIYHFDFFRLENRESAERLGLDDYFFSDGVCVIEWADRFRSIAQGRIALLITHRFTTAMFADVIHVMSAGRIVESGTHEQLINGKGLYAQGWAAQALEGA